MMFNNSDLLVFLIALSLSFLLSLFFVIVFRFGELRDKNLAKKRASHSQPTSRLGGVAALIAMQFALFSSITGFDLILLIAVSPVFAIGVWEDFGHNSPPIFRLFLAAIGAFIFVISKEIWLENINFPILDHMLSYQWFAIGFTICCLVGLTHAINLIDGVNGLASGKIIMASAATAWLASRYGESQLYLISIAIFAAALGLFLLNFPIGRIFMGDGGAYSFGLLIGICLVTLKARHPDISGWAIALIVFWPMMETVHSIWRRRRANMDSYRPDMMHMHHLIMRSLDIACGTRKYRRYTNPIATAIILPFAAFPVFTGVIFHKSGADLIPAVIFYAVLFWGTYAGLGKFAKSGQLRNKLKPMIMLQR